MVNIAFFTCQLGCIHLGKTKKAVAISSVIKIPKVYSNKTLAIHFTQRFIIKLKENGANFKHAYSAALLQ